MRGTTSSLARLYILSSEKAILQVSYCVGSQGLVCGFLLEQTTCVEFPAVLSQTLIPLEEINAVSAVFNGGV